MKKKQAGIRDLRGVGLIGRVIDIVAGLRNSNAVMQLQGAGELEHDFWREVPHFFDQSDFVHGPSLVDHDFRPSFQPPAAGGDLHFEGIPKLPQ